MIVFSEVLENAKLIYNENNQKSSCLWGQGWPEKEAGGNSPG